MVQLQLETTPLAGSAARRRPVAVEIIAVTPGEKEKGYAAAHVFSGRHQAASRSPGCSAR